MELYTHEEIDRMGNRRRDFLEAGNAPNHGDDDPQMRLLATAHGLYHARDELDVQYADRIAQLEAENKRLQTERDALDKILSGTAVLEGLGVTEERIDARWRHPIVPFLASVLYKILQDASAPNYVEFIIEAGPDDARENLAFRLQRCKGKTPHELRQEAEAEAARLRAACEAALDMIGRCELVDTYRGDQWQSVVTGLETALSPQDS